MLEGCYKQEILEVTTRERAHENPSEKASWNQLNGFVGAQGCKVNLLGADGLRSMAARMFGVSDTGTIENLVHTIEVLGRDARCGAARAFVMQHHPSPDALFSADAKARSEKLPRIRRRPAQAKPRAALGQSDRQRLEVMATRILRQASVPKPIETVARPSKAKRRKLLLREAERKRLAGEGLTKNELWEVDRRARQRALRQSKSAERR